MVKDEKEECKWIRRYADAQPCNRQISTLDECKEAGALEMKMFYVTCPYCGRRLCKAVPGSNLEIECSKCTNMFQVQVSAECSLLVQPLRWLKSEPQITKPVRT